MCLTTQDISRYTGKHHIIKLNKEKQYIDFKYQSAEVRATTNRCASGTAWSYMNSSKAFGYNPIELWLNEVDEDGDPQELLRTH